MATGASGPRETVPDGLAVFIHLLCRRVALRGAAACVGSVAAVAACAAMHANLASMLNGTRSHVIDLAHRLQSNPNFDGRLLRSVLRHKALPAPAFGVAVAEEVCGTLVSPWNAGRQAARYTAVQWVLRPLGVNVLQLALWAAAGTLLQCTPLRMTVPNTPMVFAAMAVNRHVRDSFDAASSRKSVRTPYAFGDALAVQLCHLLSSNRKWFVHRGESAGLDIAAAAAASSLQIMTWLPVRLFPLAWVTRGRIDSPVLRALHDSGIDGRRAEFGAAPVLQAFRVAGASTAGNAAVWQAVLELGGAATEGLALLERWLAARGTPTKPCDSDESLLPPPSNRGGVTETTPVRQRATQGSTGKTQRTPQRSEKKASDSTGAKNTARGLLQGLSPVQARCVKAVGRIVVAALAVATVQRVPALRKRSEQNPLFAFTFASCATCLV